MLQVAENLEKFALTQSILVRVELKWLFEL